VWPWSRLWVYATAGPHGWAWRAVHWDRVRRRACGGICLVGTWGCLTKRTWLIPRLPFMAQHLRTEQFRFADVIYVFDRISLVLHKFIFTVWSSKRPAVWYRSRLGKQCLVRFVQNLKAMVAKRSHRLRLAKYGPEKAVTRFLQTDKPRAGVTNGHRRVCARVFGPSGMMTRKQSLGAVTRLEKETYLSPS
jgi:hypothetical protein